MFINILVTKCHSQNFIQRKSHRIPKFLGKPAKNLPNTHWVHYPGKNWGTNNPLGTPGPRPITRAPKAPGLQSQLYQLLICAHIFAHTCTVTHWAPWPIPIEIYGVMEAPYPHFKHINSNQNKSFHNNKFVKLTDTATLHRGSRSDSTQ